MALQGSGREGRGRASIHSLVSISRIQARDPAAALFALGRNCSLSFRRVAESNLKRVTRFCRSSASFESPLQAFADSSADADDS